jgi:hypothetical protein
LLPGADLETLRHQSMTGQLGLPGDLLGRQPAAGGRPKPAKLPPLFRRRL